ncbi:sensor histidine kinase [Nocardia arthritidis]|uniref:histidine kinase n=1 Tax=Nocardia arthritidis TaxID=228602 RepID=A0A6G9YI71_9NOCA|nr:histidine kinase [Nocardia arthritidis]QIS12949.1 sensor histidine kinase [Nocardia arthritidis]
MTGSQHVYFERRTAAFAARSRRIWTDPATWRDLLWTIADPVVGGALAVSPAALIAFGIGAIALLPLVFGPLAVACVAIGWFIAPKTLRWHGRWTALLLGPPTPAGLARGRAWRRWFGAGLLSVFRGVVLSGLSLIALPLLLICLLAAVFTGPVVAMWVVSRARWLPNLFRRLGGHWSGVELPAPYLTTPRLPERESAARQSTSAWWAAFSAGGRALWHDPSTWRDLLWLAAQPLVGTLTLLPAALIGYGIWGLALPALQVPFGMTPSPGYGELFGAVWPAVPAGLLLAAAGLTIAPKLLRLHGRWLTLLLRPTGRARLLIEREQLTARVERLTETRADAVARLGAELRRIERDLHDGAQARLVALGMTLGAVEALIDRDPAAAKNLVAQARNASVAALAELRGLVRGIHPPVLAERGLVDAIRAQALDCPVPVTVDAALDGTVDPPVDSAVYFAVAELLTNAVRHADPRNIRITVRHSGAVLRVTVADDGSGGADPNGGSGLRGLERRLGGFDGRVAIDSPAGGPTMVTLEVPCVLSSPRTSSSSATA